MKSELIKQIKDYPDYWVSTLGNIYSMKNGKEKELKQGKGSRGYLQVSLSSKTYSVHRLVAQAFIPNPDNLPQVNHKDESKENNCVSNLEWCTAEYNCNYANRNNKISETQKRSGIQRNNKYTSKEVYQYTLDGKFVNTYPSIREAVRQTGLDHSAISKVCRGKIKYTGGFIWSYTPLPYHNTQL